MHTTTLDGRRLPKKPAPRLLKQARASSAEIETPRPICEKHGRSMRKHDKARRRRDDERMAPRRCWRLSTRPLQRTTRAPGACERRRMRKVELRLTGNEAPTNIGEVELSCHQHRARREALQVTPTGEDARNETQSRGRGPGFRRARSRGAEPSSQSIVPARGRSRHSVSQSAPNNYIFVLFST